MTHFIDGTIVSSTLATSIFLFRFLFHFKLCEEELIFIGVAAKEHEVAYVVNAWDRHYNFASLYCSSILRDEVIQEEPSGLGLHFSSFVWLALWGIQPFPGFNNLSDIFQVKTEWLMDKSIENSQDLTFRLCYQTERGVWLSCHQVILTHDCNK